MKDLPPSRGRLRSPIVKNLLLSTEETQEPRSEGPAPSTEEREGASHSQGQSWCSAGPLAAHPASATLPNGEEEVRGGRKGRGRSGSHE